MRIPRALGAAFAVCSIVAASLAVPAASAAEPPITVPPASLASSLACAGNPAVGPTPVLLVPGTTLTAKINFNWNYEKKFTAAGRAWCAVTVPDLGMADIQVAAEYIVNGVRTLHARANRKIAIVGYSQGGMSPRWALKYWPDTRAMVDDMISIDGSNHGTLDTIAICALACAPAIWQQARGSHFLTALNAGGETFAGISYSQIYSLEDEIVVPNFGPAASTALHTGGGQISNVPVQSVCPLDLADHITMGTIDPVAYSLVLDALTHTGPAEAARIPKSVCTQLIIPGLDPASVALGEVQVGATAGYALASTPVLLHEPALATYAN